MNSKMRTIGLVAVGLMVFSGLAMASPPVPPPIAGYNIVTNGVAEVSLDDFVKEGSFTSTWVYDTLNHSNGQGSTLATLGCLRHRAVLFLQGNASRKVSATFIPTLSSPR